MTKKAMKARSASSGKRRNGTKKAMKVKRASSETCAMKKARKAKAVASSTNRARSSQKQSASSRRESKRRTSTGASSGQDAKRLALKAAEIVEKMEDVNWVPLESNPDMLNEFAHAVGLPKKYGFVDVLGFEPELLQMVPEQCIAFTLLYECSKNLERYKRQQKNQIKASGQVLSDRLFFIKQYVGNACGTIAALHCLANSADRLGFSKNSSVGRFVSENKGQSPDAIGLALADFSEFHEASEESAEGGQTEAPEADVELNHHFIAFVEQEGDVYEMDGTKAFPINHGPVGDSLLNTVVRVVQDKFMAHDSESIQFNMMALVKCK